MKSPIIKSSLIVAMDNNRLIGRDNQLPWHLPADLAYFKAKTINKSIVMGRKTYDSIGRALPARNNIVLSRNTNLKLAGVSVVQNLAQAEMLALENANNQKELMIIGGSSLYKLALNTVDKMYISYIDYNFVGDTWFPEIDNNIWQEVEVKNHKKDDKNAYNLRFVTYARKNK